MVLISYKNSCGHTLLETIDHVLDSAGMANTTENTNKRFPRTHSETDEMHKSKFNLRTLTEQVIDSVYAERMTRITEASDLMVFFHMSVIVVVDIAWRQDWDYQVDSGAYRRILMNLFNNAMKHTAVGFVKVAVSMEQDFSVALSGDETPRQVLTITVSDSGKDISRLFLQGGRQTNLKQDDARLGLHIVRQLLFDVQGKVDFISGKIGTKVFVSIPVTGTHQKVSDETDDIISEVRDRLKGSHALVVSQDFNITADMEKAAPGSLPAGSQAMLYLKASMQAMMTQWFDMKLVTPNNDDVPDDDVPDADVWLLMASENTEEMIRSQLAKKRKKVPQKDTEVKRGHHIKTKSSDVDEAPAKKMAVVAICGVSYLGRNFTTEDGINVYYVRLP